MSEEDRKDLEVKIVGFLSNSTGPKRADEVYEHFVDARANQSAVLSAIWRLLDQHQIKLDRNLQLVAIHKS